MPTRVCQFTDTSEWYAGSKTKDSFREPLEDWVAQIGEAHDRPVEGFEFEASPDDPRTGTLVEDAPPDPGTLRDPQEAPLTPTENKALRTLLAAQP